MTLGVGTYHPAVFDKDADSMRGVSIQGFFSITAMFESMGPLKRREKCTR